MKTRLSGLKHESLRARLTIPPLVFGCGVNQSHPSVAIRAILGQPGNSGSGDLVLNGFNAKWERKPTFQVAPNYTNGAHDKTNRNMMFYHNDSYTWVVMDRRPSVCAEGRQLKTASDIGKPLDISLPYRFPVINFGGGAV